MIRTLSILSLLAVLGLAGCATGGAALYKPANKDIKNSIGYTDQQIDATHARISAVVPQASGVQAAQDVALLRAADMTVAQGHAWFRLLNQTLAQVQVQRQAPSFQTASMGLQCGPGASGGSGAQMGGMTGCSYQPSPNSMAGVQQTGVATYETRLLAVLDVEMGDGALPAGDHVYDAKATADRLRASLAGKS